MREDVVIAGLLGGLVAFQLLSTYARRVAFVALVGAVIALSGDLTQVFLDARNRDYTVLLAINNVPTWFLMGLVVAWKVKLNGEWAEGG